MSLTRRYVGWDWGFSLAAPGQEALCRVCNRAIPKGQASIRLITRHANKECRLFVHPDCFPEKSAIT